MKRETEPFAWGLIASLYYLLLIAVLFSQLSCQAPRRLATTGTLRTVATVSYAAEVHAVCSNHTKGTGSGVFVGGDVLLTAWHVIDCGTGHVLNVTVKTSTSQVFLADVVHEWRYRDVAKLRVYGYVARDDPVAFAAVSVGDRLCSASISPYLRSVCGPVDEMHDTVCPDSKWCHNASYMSDGQVIPGNSGSAVYNTNGELVGLITGGTLAWVPTQYAMVTRLWDLREDLK